MKKVIIILTHLMLSPSATDLKTSRYVFSSKLSNNVTLLIVNNNNCFLIFKDEYSSAKQKKKRHHKKKPKTTVTDVDHRKDTTTNIPGDNEINDQQQLVLEDTDPHNQDTVKQN
jgi:hypothetical protein